jgi:prepilin-type N-terminal cleavage/methylation domain-containing protein
MRSQTGMTLLEVLVALMVLALTGLLLTDGLSLGTRLWERAGAGAGAAVARADALATLRRLVEQSEPPGAADAGETFVGDPQGLAFISREGARLSAGTAQRIEIYRAVDQDAVRLRIAAVGADEQPDDLPMLSGVAELSLRYYGFDETLAAYGWVDQWTGRPALPTLVEMTVAYADGTPLSVLRVAPRRQASVECLVFGGGGCGVRRP